MKSTTKISLYFGRFSITTQKQDRDATDRQLRKQHSVSQGKADFVDCRCYDRQDWKTERVLFLPLVILGWISNVGESDSFQIQNKDSLHCLIKKSVY